MGRGKKPRQNLPSARRHCIICDKIIATQSGLEMHMNQHTGERPYFCRYCDATFTSKSSEVVHTQGVHLGVKHPCPKCEKEYKSQSNLSAHVKYCTGTGNVTKVSRKTGNTGSKGTAGKLQEKQKERKVKREVSEKKKGGGGRVRKNDKKKGQIRMSVPVPEEKSGVFGSFRSAASVYAQLLQLEQEEEEAQKNQDYSFFLHLNRYKPDDSCFSPNYPPPRVNTPEEVEERVPLNASPVEEEEEQEDEEDDWNSKQMEVQKKKKLIKKTSALKAVKRKRSSGGSKGKFKCRQCGKAYQAQANLNEHLLMHSGVKPFPCHFCKVAFTKKVK